MERGQQVQPGQAGVISLGQAKKVVLLLVVGHEREHRLAGGLVVRVAGVADLSIHVFEGTGRIEDEASTELTMCESRTLTTSRWAWRSGLGVASIVPRGGAVR
jgi:hypothetical protein